MNVSCACGNASYQPRMGGLGTYQNYVFNECNDSNAKRFCSTVYPCPPGWDTAARCVRVKPAADRPQGQLP